MKYPLVERELRILGRKRLTYLLRALVPVVALMLLGLYVMERGSLRTPSQAAVALSIAALCYQVAVLVFVVPLLASAALVNERDENTLDLLALADFRGFDLVLSKLAGIGLHILLLLAGVLPLYAFISFLGGLNFVAMSMQFVLVAIHGFFLCGVGLYFSVQARSPREALVATYAFMIAWLTTTTAVFIGTSLWAPFAINITPWIYTAKIIDGGAQPMDAIPAIVVCAIAGVVFLVLAILTIRRRADSVSEAEGSRPPAARRPWFGQVTPSQTLLARAADYPVPAEARSRGFVVATLVFTLMLLIPVFGWYVLLLFVGMYSMMFMRGAYKEGGLEDLWLTPHSDSRIARIVFGVFLQRAWVVLPALPFALVYTFILLSDALMPALAEVDMGYAMPGVLVLYVPALIVQLLFALLTGLAANVRGGVLYQQLRRVIGWQSLCAGLTLIPLPAVLPLVGVFTGPIRPNATISFVAASQAWGTVVYIGYVTAVYSIGAWHFNRVFRAGVRSDPTVTSGPMIGRKPRRLQPASPGSTSAVAAAPPR